VISFRYGDAGWPVSPDGAGHSLVLARLGGDPEEAGSWSASAYVGGSPGSADPSQTATAATSTTVTLVDIGSPGRYFKGSKEPSPSANGQPTTAWTQVTFDDNPTATSWLDGPGAAQQRYAASCSGWHPTEDMNGKYISAYARLRFTLPAEQAASFSQLQAEVHYDDGFVLYLNGTRVGDMAPCPPPAAYNASGGPAVTSRRSSRWT
jgi:hypothetical protein